jgi:hypothetical protein
MRRHLGLRHSGSSGKHVTGTARQPGRRHNALVPATNARSRQSIARKTTSAGDAPAGHAAAHEQQARQAKSTRAGDEDKTARPGKGAHQCSILPSALHSVSNWVSTTSNTTRVVPSEVASQWWQALVAQLGRSLRECKPCPPPFAFNSAGAFWKRVANVVSVVVRRHACPGPWGLDQPCMYCAPLLCHVRANPVSVQKSNSLEFRPPSPQVTPCDQPCAWFLCFSPATSTSIGRCSTWTACAPGMAGTELKQSPTRRVLAGERSEDSQVTYEAADASQRLLATTGVYACKILCLSANTCPHSAYFQHIACHGLVCTLAPQVPPLPSHRVCKGHSCCIYIYLCLRDSIFSGLPASCDLPTSGGHSHAVAASWSSPWQVPLLQTHCMFHST